MYFPILAFLPLPLLQLIEEVGEAFEHFFEWMM